MTTNPTDVSSRILAAATLAEQAAAKAIGERWHVIRVAGEHAVLTETNGIVETVYTGIDNARLIAASSPSHWGAVAELLRRIVEIQYRGAASRDFEASAIGLLAAKAVLPLVDQIIRDLGEGQNGS